MISKITYTPTAFAAQNYNNFCGPRKATTPMNFNRVLQQDTVSFTSKTTNGLYKATETEIRNAFGRLILSKKAHNTKLGQIFGTTENGVDVAVQEVELGKLARLTLTNGNFPNNTFIGIDIAKDGQKISLSPLDEAITSVEAEKYVQAYISTAR